MKTFNRRQLVAAITITSVCPSMMLSDQTRRVVQTLDADGKVIGESQELSPRLLEWLQHPYGEVSFTAVFNAERAQIHISIRFSDAVKLHRSLQRERLMPGGPLAMLGGDTLNVSFRIAVA